MINEMPGSAKELVVTQSRAHARLKVSSAVAPACRPAQHFDDLRRLAGAQDADAEDFAGHP